MSSPQSPDACFQQGLQFLNHDKAAAAAAAFRAAVTARPDWAEAHSNLGVALGRCGQHAEALACFERALKIRPDYADAHQNLSNT